MKRFIFTGFLCCLLAGVARAQVAVEAPEREAEPKKDEIETDRDSFTPATTLVGPQRLILESAYTFFDYRQGERHSYPELLLRYGAVERLELRFGFNFEQSTSLELLTGEKHAERESNLNLGVKLRISEQDGLLPQSAFVLTALVPTSGPETNTLFVGTYVFGWELPNRAKLDAAIRYGTAVEERDHFSEWAPSVVYKMPIGERWSVHAEYFGIFTSDKKHDDVQHYFSPGVHCLVNPDLELGVRVAWGLNDQSARFLVNAGLGYRY